MNGLALAAGAALMMLIATGTYNLQWWLERCEYERHFED